MEDPYILRRMDSEQLRRFQNVSFKTILNYAYTVPLYKEKYITAGVHPRDIRGLEDIKKLPCVTKEDLRRNFPTRVVPPSFQTNSAIVAATSGTTGRSLSLYFDLPIVIRSMLGFRRALLEHGIFWQKTRMSLLLDLSENSFENKYFFQSIFSMMKRLFSTRQMQILDIRSSPADLITQIDHFRPDIILGYPFVILQLASLKMRGRGKNITPEYIVTSGAVFDRYSRRFVEETFHTRVFDIYAATESGIIAFECEKNRYHVCSDLVFLECLQDGEDVAKSCPGTLQVTRLYGKGTPLVRYQGMEDVVTLSPNRCSCGLTGDIIEGIYGRESQSIVLPDGTLVMVSVFENCIGKVLYDVKVNKIKRIQIVQNKIDTIEVRILFDEYLRDTGCSADETLSLINQKLLERLGNHVNLTLKEVSKFDTKAPYILSSLDRTSVHEKHYLI